MADEQQNESLLEDMGLNRRHNFWIPLLLIPIAFIVGWALRDNTTFGRMMGGVPVTVPSGTIAQCVIPNP